jgi:hypothetical protein
MRPTVDLAGTEMRVLLPCADLAFATNLVDLRSDAVHVAIRQEPRSQPKCAPVEELAEFLCQLRALPFGSIIARHDISESKASRRPVQAGVSTMQKLFLFCALAAPFNVSHAEAPGAPVAEFEDARPPYELARLYHRDAQVPRSRKAGGKRNETAKTRNREPTISTCTAASSLMSQIVFNPETSSWDRARATGDWAIVKRPREIPGLGRVRAVMVDNVATTQTPAKGSTATGCSATVTFNAGGIIAAAESEENRSEMAEHGASAEEITDAVKAVWQMWAYAVTFHPSMGDLPLPDQTTKGDDAEEHLDHDQLLRLLSSRLSINEVQYTVTPLAAGGYAVQIIHIDQQWQ